MIGRTVASFVLFSLLAISVANATTPEDVSGAVEMMHGASSKGLIFRKDYSDGGVQIVFAEGNLRYTFVHRGQSLAVWVRPDGSSDKDSLATFADEELDGKVDMGVGGEKFFFPYTNKGTQYMPFWQRQYDDAIWTLIHHFAVEKN